LDPLPLLQLLQFTYLSIPCMGFFLSDLVSKTLPELFNKLRDLVFQFHVLDSSSKGSTWAPYSQ